MFIILLVTALFIFISIFYFFRAEKLQRTVMLLKRENVSTRNENKALSKSIVLVSKNYENFAKQRFLQLRTTTNNNIVEIDTFKPLIDNYSTIFIESLKNKGKFQGIAKTYFERQDNKVFDQFFKQIEKDPKIKRLWSSNNLVGFIGLVEALLLTYERIKYEKTAKANTPTLNK